MTNTPIATVESLWRYPVKSLRGERLPRLGFDARGAIGDRLWAIYDEAGKLGSGKTADRFRRIDGLFELSARLEGELAVITFPDGTRRRVDAPDVEDALSRQLGLPLRLRREDQVRHHDAAPVHLVTTASLATLGSTLSSPPADARRFRANLVLAVESAGFSEDGWLGRTLAVGAELRLRLTKRTRRCRMTTLAQAELPEDPRVLRELGRLNEACFGIYAEVLSPGTVAEGDLVFFVGPPA